MFAVIGIGAGDVVSRRVAGLANLSVLSAGFAGVGIRNTMACLLS